MGAYSDQWIDPDPLPELLRRAAHLVETASVRDKPFSDPEFVKELQIAATQLAIDIDDLAARRDRYWGTT